MDKFLKKYVCNVNKKREIGRLNGSSIKNVWILVNIASQKKNHT